MCCFAINEIKATVIAQMCCTPGFTPFVLNLFQSDIVGLDPDYTPEDPITGELMLSKKPPTWLQVLRGFTRLLSLSNTFCYY
jgi:hypothetical protein